MHKRSKWRALERDLVVGLAREMNPDIENSRGQSHVREVQGSIFAVIR